jgi:hypothetical protein
MGGLMRRIHAPVEPVLLAADLAVWIGGAYCVGIFLG